MNQNLINILELVRAKYAKYYPPVDNFGPSEESTVYAGQEVSDLIKKKLSEDKPVMIARFGSGELNCVLNYYFINWKKSFFEKSFQYIRGEILPFWWDEKIIKEVANNAGLFPPTTQMAERFSLQMLEDMKQVDILGSWLKGEKVFQDQLSNCIKVKLRDLEPYYHQDPWSEVLKNKTVLVIHPFTESITKQYSKRKLLFDDSRVLPEFELKTLKAVQSLAQNKTEFNDWFEGFDYMCEKIVAIDFDVAIIGCGAYGFPLAAFVKKIDKKAIHLGGAVQILFGIQGKRWEKHPYISKLFNEHWTKPLPSETPQNFTTVEGGCYW